MTTDIAALRKRLEDHCTGELRGNDYWVNLFAMLNALPSLLSELDAARAVVQAAKSHRERVKHAWTFNMRKESARDLDKALAAYEEACK